MKTRSQVSSETSQRRTSSEVSRANDLNSLNASTASRRVDIVRVNASQETRAITHGQDRGGDQSHSYSSLEALPILGIGGSQQHLRINENADRRRRCALVVSK